MLPRAKYTVHLRCANPQCKTWDNIKKDWGGGCPLPSWVDRAALAVALHDKPTKHRDRVCQRCGHERKSSERYWPANLVIPGTIEIDCMLAAWQRLCLMVGFALLPSTCGSWAVMVLHAWSPFFPFLHVSLVPMSSSIVANTRIVPLIRPV